MDDAIAKVSLQVSHVVEFDPNSRYLLVFELWQGDEEERGRLSMHALERIKGQIDEALGKLLEGVKFEVLVADSPIYLTSYQFKEAPEGDSSSGLLDEQFQAFNR